MSKAKKLRVLDGWYFRDPFDGRQNRVAPQQRVKLCSDKQHAECTKKLACELATPICELDRNRMGCTPDLNFLSTYRCSREELEQYFVRLSARDERIAKLLGEYQRKCHRVRVTVEELK